MTTQLEVYKFQAYKQRQAHDIDGVRPVMIPDDDGDWVSRHTAEHLADMLKTANKRIAELEETEVVIPSIWKHYSNSKVAFIYEQAMDDAGVKWRSVDD